MAKYLISLVLFFILNNAYCQYNKALDTSRYVFIAEANHGFDTVTLEQIKYLDNEMNPFGATLFFEAPFTDAVIAYLENRDYDYFVYPFWATETIKPIFKKFIKENEIKAWGFDMQENCKFRYFNKFLLKNNYIDSSQSSIKYLTQVDSILSFSLTKDGNAHRELRPLTASEVVLFHTAIDSIKKKIIEKKHTRKKYDLDLILKVLDNRKILAKFLSIKYYRTNLRVALRDESMANNFLFLDSLFSAEMKKSILWGAGGHFAKKKGMEGNVKNFYEYIETRTNQSNYLILFASLNRVARFYTKRALRFDQFDDLKIVNTKFRTPPTDYNCE